MATQKQEAQYYLSLGAGKNQLPLIQAAKAEGYYVIGVDININAPGFEFCDLKIQESIFNYRKIQHKIEMLMLEGKIEGGYCASYGNAIASFAFLVERFSIHGLNRTLVESLLDKALVRQKLQPIVDDQYFSQPKFLCPQKKVTRQDLDSLGFPLIIKTRHGFGKKNIFLAENYTMAKEILVKNVFENDKIPLTEIILEEFIEGDEITVCGFAQNFQFTLLSVTDKITSNQAPFIEMEHRFPSQYGSLIDIISEMHQKMISALQISFAPIVSEWKIRHNRLYLVEISAQVPGEYLSQFVIPHGLHYDYYKNLVYLTTGKTIDKVSATARQNKKVTVKYCCETMDQNQWNDYKQGATFAEILNEKPLWPPQSNHDRFGVIGLVEP